MNSVGGTFWGEIDSGLQKGRIDLMASVIDGDW